MIAGKAANAGFPPLRGEEKWQCRFTAVSISGKAANAAFPPLGEEEKWQCSFTAVLSSDKEAKCGSSSVLGGGKAADAALHFTTGIY